MVQEPKVKQEKVAKPAKMKKAKMAKPAKMKKEKVAKVNVMSNDTSVVIEAELAGYKKDEIDIATQDGVLTISGKTSQSTEQTDKVVYLLRELKRSAFSRSFKIGDQLDVSDVDAKFNNGLLTVTIQKLEKEPESKKVTIK